MICTFLFVPFLTSLGQTASSVLFEQGDSLYNAGAYFDAYLSYERVVFSSSDELVRAQATLRRTGALKKLGQFTKAREGLERINFAFLPNDTLRYWGKYETALCSYLEGNFSEAQYHLQQAEHMVQNKAMLRQAQFLKLLVMNEMHQWDNAKELAKTLVMELNHPQQDSLLAEVDWMYSKKNIPRLKSEKTAENWATWVPGMGHVYSGRPLEGFFSFVFNAAAFGYMIFNVINANYLTALTINATIIQSFYQGGIRRAKFLSRVRNHEQLREFNGRIKLFFTNLYLQELSTE